MKFFSVVTNRVTAATGPEIVIFVFHERASAVLQIGVLGRANTSHTKGANHRRDKNKVIY